MLVGERGFEPASPGPETMKFVWVRISVSCDSAIQARERLELEAEPKLDCSGIIRLAADHAE